MKGAILTALDQLAANSVIADALQLALQQDVFTQLRTAQTPSLLADQLGWHPEPTAHLLELLWSSKLLTRSGLAYQTAEQAQPFLSRQGERYLGEAWCYRLHSLRDFGQQLGALLRQPLPGFSEPLAQDAAWAAAASRQIAQEQRALTADTASAIAARLPHFTRPANLLDMGGGPGLVSVALGQRYPQLRGVVQELPLTAQVAQTNFQQAGLADRFSGRSTLRDDERFDIIWCSSFLHFVADPQETLGQLFQRLRPGGVLISAHAQIASAPDEARAVLPFFLPLLLRGRSVFHRGELRELLLQAGFDCAPGENYAFPLAPLTVHLAFKPG